MSGGHFDYAQYRINDIVQELEHVIETNGESEFSFSPEVIAEFKKGALALKRASVYAQRIDWLLSGDDGEESFFRRLREELDEQEE